MTNPATPVTRIFAERLLAREVDADERSTVSLPAAIRVCEKLRYPLTAIAGAAGFRSLLHRALTLAQREAPSLSTLQVNQDGSLAGLDQSDGHQNNSHAEGAVLLVAELIGLLLLFIGEDLTLRLTQSVWPDESFSTTDRRRDNEA